MEKLLQLQEHGAKTAMYPEGAALERLSVLQEVGSGQAHISEKPGFGEATRAEGAYCMSEWEFLLHCLSSALYCQSQTCAN